MLDRLCSWLHGLFNRPRCDMDVCENSAHARVHIQNSGRAYVPMNLLVKSFVKAEAAEQDEEMKG